MNKKMLLKKIEDVISDKELDDDAKVFLINSYLKIARKTQKKAK